MKNKYYEFDINGRCVQVEADVEGLCRYMVRISDAKLPGAFRVRAGYLTGRNRSWNMECFGGPDIHATSAKQACQQLAAWASRQPGMNKGEQPHD